MMNSLAFPRTRAQIRAFVRTGFGEAATAQVLPTCRSSCDTGPIKRESPRASDARVKQNRRKLSTRSLMLTLIDSDGRVRICLADKVLQ